VNLVENDETQSFYILASSKFWLCKIFESLSIILSGGDVKANAPLYKLFIIIYCIGAWVSGLSTYYVGEFWELFN
jgi:hypothetical protein